MKRWPVPAVLLSLALAGMAACTPPPGPLAGMAAIEPQPVLLPGTSYVQLGRRLLRARDPGRAHKAFIRALTVEGVSAEALTGAGVASERLGLLTRARSYFTKARDLAPRSIAAHNNLGAVLYRLEEYYAARQAFQAAFGLSNGSSTIAEHNLGLSEMTIARIEDAQAPDPAISHELLRLGSGEYRLMERPKPEGES